MDNYNMQNNYAQTASSIDLSARLSSVMKSVYVKMFLGLLVTAFVALFAAGTPAVLNFLYTHSAVMWILFGAEILLVIAISGAINRLSPAMATLLFFLFAVVNGLALTPIFLIYTGASIAKTFFITAGVFGAMSVYGYFTTQDLSKWGSYLIMALFGLIIVSVVNIFTKSTTLDWIISGAGVLIFIGLTAWDNQQIKRMALESPEFSASKLATIGALSLYLDFINLFLYLLRFFGNRD